VLAADNIVDGFSFIVDISMSHIIVQVSDNYHQLQNVSFTSPSGDEFTNYTLTVDLPSLKQYSMLSVESGLWLANVSNSGEVFSVIVTASSHISFTWQFALLDDNQTHPSYSPITGNPIRGTEYIIVIKVHGSINPMTDQPRDLLSNITNILFINLAGDVVSRLPANELIPLKQYEASAVLPDIAFRIGVEGVDTSDHEVRRVDQSVLSSAVITLEVGIVGSGSFWLAPGESVNVSVSVTNVGDIATWYIRISDTLHFYTGVSPIVITLNRNETSVLFIQCRVPISSKSGLSSTVTVSAGTASASSVENYEVFYINVVPSAKDTQPGSGGATKGRRNCRGLPRADRLNCLLRRRALLGRRRNFLPLRRARKNRRG